MNKLKKWFELTMLNIAYQIIYGRNVQRSAFISRRDNNELSHMGEKIEGIYSRIREDYKDA
jgi:hypothetical protein